MATAWELRDRRVLVRAPIALRQHLQPERTLLMTPLCTEWYSTELPQIPAFWNTEVSPKDQIDALLEAYIAKSDQIRNDYDIKSLRPAEGIWEFKTADIRVFGWFWQPDVFIAACGGDANETKIRNLYPGYINQTIRLCSGLDLDLPKAIPGDDLNAVLSR